MRADDYIPGLDDPREAPVDEFEERLLAYGFTHEDIERCLAEIECYAKQGRRS